MSQAFKEYMVILLTCLAGLLIIVSFIGDRSCG